MVAVDKKKGEIITKTFLPYHAMMRNRDLYFAPFARFCAKNSLTKDTPSFFMDQKENWIELKKIFLLPSKEKNKQITAPNYRTRSLGKIIFRDKKDIEKADVVDDGSFLVTWSNEKKERQYLILLSQKSLPDQLADSRIWEKCIDVVFE
jgi:hypothetical protein